MPSLGSRDAARPPGALTSLRSPPRLVPWTLDAHFPQPPRRFRRLGRGCAPASQPSALRLSRPSNASCATDSSCLALRRGACATTTASADCCTPSSRLPARLARYSVRAEVQLSQGKIPDCRSIHPPHLRPFGPDDIGLRVFTPSRPQTVASYAIRVPRVGALLTASFPHRLATMQLLFG